MRKLPAATLGLALLLAVPRAALACPVCFGENDSPLALAMNQGIFFMLLVVFGMLGAFATFFIKLARRQRLAAQQPPEGEDFGRHDPREGTV